MRLGTVQDEVQIIDSATLTLIALPDIPYATIRIELHNNYTGRDRINERVHIALEWAEDVDGLERGLEGFGLDDELESWMALKKRKRATYESPPNSLFDSMLRRIRYAEHGCK